MYHLRQLLPPRYFLKISAKHKPLLSLLEDQSELELRNKVKLLKEKLYKYKLKRVLLLDLKQERLH